MANSESSANTYKPLTWFFLATFAITWPCFIAYGSLSGVTRVPVLYVGIFAPAIVAIGLTALTEGSSGVRTLLQPLFKWDVGARWYLFALTYMAAIKLTVAVLYRFITGSWPPFGDESWYAILGATILSTIVGGQSGEEIGWRGYALPRLAARIGFAGASIVIGFIWALWHLPLFLVAGADKSGQSFVVYTVGVVAISVAITWLYVRTGGSLLLTMLMHSAINQSIGIVSSVTTGSIDVFSMHASLVAWLTAALLWISAAVFLPKLKS